jgi:GH25 family lysozyme M1 (1,4-beta-N-acetylmuramidase)
MQDDSQKDDHTIYAHPAYWRGYRAGVKAMDAAALQFLQMWEAGDPAPFCYVYTSTFLPELIKRFQELYDKPKETP